nr:hypothetical protein [Deltaproteobacteria bacterium]
MTPDAQGALDAYGNSNEHTRDEVALVGIFVDRALERGRRSGWLAGTSITDAPGDHALVEAFRRIEQRLASCREASRMLPMDALRQRMALTLTEQRVLWTLIGFEIDPQLRRLLRQIASEQVSGVSVGTLLSIVYEDAPGTGIVELGPKGKLAHRCLIELDPSDAGAPVSQRRVRIADRVLEIATGVVRLDPVVQEFAELEAPATPIESLAVAPAVVERFVRALSDADANWVVAYGRSGSGRRSLLAACAAAIDCPVLTIDARKLATAREELHRQLRLIARECRLLAVVPLFCHLDTLAPASDVPDRLDLVENTSEGLALGTCVRPIARRWKRPPVSLEIPILNGAQRAMLWGRVLPTASVGDAELLATMYPLAPALIRAVGAVAVRQCGDEEMRPEHVESGIRSVLDD